MVNIGNMMKQAQQLQKKMSEAQEKLNSIEVEGVSGGGLVKVTATAKGEIKRILLDNFTFLKSKLSELKTIILPERSFLEFIILLITSLACIVPIIPAKVDIIPSVSQLY